MNRRRFFVFGLTGGLIAAQSQQASDSELARLLADPRGREQAIKILLASGVRVVPLLLKWTTDPPSGVLKYDLYAGLAVAFGRLRVKEAVPFLVSNIAVQGEARFPWQMKAPEVIAERLPAIKALVEIGSEAVPSLVEAYSLEARGENRLALLQRSRS